MSEAGVVNAAPFSFFNVVSADPPLLMVSVQRRLGEQKDTARNAILRGEFVIHICDVDHVHQLNQTAATVASDVSEVELAGLTLVDSTVVDIPGFRESKVRFECKLDRVIELGDTATSCDMLIGRVVYYHVADEIEQSGRIDPRGLNPVARLAGNDYSTLGDIFTIDRPR